MLKNGMTYTDKLLDIVYNCQMCGACGVSCNYAMDMEVIEPISEFRIKCVEDGQTNPALDKTHRRPAAAWFDGASGGKARRLGCRAGAERRHQGEGGRPLSRRLSHQLSTRICKSWPKPRRRSCRKPASISVSPAMPRSAAAAAPTRWATRKIFSLRPGRTWP